MGESSSVDLNYIEGGIEVEENLAKSGQFGTVETALVVPKPVVPLTDL